MNIVMQLWDELQRDRAEVIVVGATNRPQDLDPAIQRRFERSLLIPSPDLPARKEIFARILRNVGLDADFDAYRCAQATEGYTSSDLAVVCKSAVRAVLKELPRDVGIDRPARPLRTEVCIVTVCGGTLAGAELSFTLCRMFWRR
jgi:SpoVK/Ycf46/Vps4 family AAA+-type ATPase